MRRLTTEEFIEKARKIHGDRYDYSKVEYKDSHTKVPIICPDHGVFWMPPNTHLSGRNCPKCVHRGYKLTTEEWVENAKAVHGDRYDYSKANYITNADRVCIICPEHGEFWQIARNHISGAHCPKCGKLAMAKAQMLKYDEFVEKAREIHGDRYDYSKSVLIGMNRKTTIVCPEHGEFQQTPSAHLNCRQGCPICKTNHYEREINFLLENAGINHVQQYRPDFLKPLSLDFYLPDYNLAIEAQGIQHFKPLKHWGGEDALRKMQERDERKLKLCQEHGVKILYYSDLNIEFPYEVITSLEKLLEIIKNSPIFAPEVITDGHGIGLDD